MQYTLGNKTFKNKTAVNAEARRILNTHTIGDILTPEETTFMVDLIGHHRNAKQKIGVGVKQIDIRTNPVYGTRGFWIVRTDNTETDFSYLQCLTHTTSEKDFRKACRTAVRGDIFAFRCENWTEGMLCPILGVPITLGNLHVDHAAPNTFETLVQRFIVEYNVNIDRVAVNESADSEVETYFVDEEFKKSWVAFHNKHASLRLVSRQANLSTLKTSNKEVRQLQEAFLGFGSKDELKQKLQEAFR